VPDAELLTALKQAKSKKMFFAFVPRGGSDGQLIVAKTKIPPKQIADAKKAIGGGNAVTGKCFGGDSGTMVFEVGKPASPALAATVKKVAKRDTGLAIEPTFQVAGDADAEEQAPGAAAAGTAAPAAAPVAPPASPPQANVLGIQKALQKLGYDPGKIDGVMTPPTQAAVKKFQQANGLPADGLLGAKSQAALARALQGLAAAGGGPAPPADEHRHVPGSVGASAPAVARGADDWAAIIIDWQTARNEAIKDLKALATKVAATKHGSAVAVLKEVNAIIAKLPAKPAPNDLDKLENFVRNDETITEAEKLPTHFHNVNIREPLLKALAAMRK
jgi:Putative peptidoglycan binding domain